MTNVEKLALINSLEIIDSDGDGDALCYVMVENSPESRKVLREIGVTNVDKYIRKYGLEIYETDTEFDLVPAVNDYTNADWFDGEKFSIRDYAK